MELTRLIVTKPDGTFVGDVDPSRVVDVTFVHEVNGEHSMTLVTFDEYTKNDRLLWCDEMGVWHENVVEGAEGEHGEHGDTLHTYWCPWSLQHDLSGTFVTEMPGTGGIPVPAATALGSALSGTERWKVGTVTRMSTGGASMWRMSGWEALQVLIEVWGGELSVTIVVGVNGVVERYVNLLEQVGATVATRRFDYGGDVMGIKRTVSDQPWTCRIIPLGKAQQTDGGGYGRKVTIEEANGGVIWLQNDDVVGSVRVPDGNGGWEYPTQVVENGDIDDPAKLKAWALEHIAEWTTPKASYEVDVMQLVAAGTDATGVSEGDSVAIVDRDFAEDGLVIVGRALRIEGSLLDPTQTTLTISNLGGTLGGQLDSIARSVATLEQQQQATSLYQATATYLSNLITRLNAEINATGGYWYMVPGLGTRTYDREVSDPAVGAEASKVVEVRGGNIRIADSRTSGGDWDWRTVFQSGHILADLVTAAKLTAGYIGSADSGNYWNLDTGEFRMASTSMLGNKTVQQVINGVNATITNVDVEYAQGDSPTQAPQTGWSTTAPQWQSGKYIWSRTATTTAGSSTPEYSQPVMISGRDGTDGTDGTSVTIKGNYNTLAELQAAHPTGSDGDAYMVGADLYVWNGTEWENVGQIQGPQGPAGQNGTSVTVSSIQYGTSTSASTSPTSWSTTPPTSIAAGRWLWVRTNYSNGSTATTKSYIGTDGTDGKSVYVQSNSKVGGVTTIVLANTDGTTSTIRIADGEDGANGQPGPAGADGESTYIHVAWANSQDGTTDFSTTVSTGKSYLGVYTDSTAADSTSPSSYSWSRIEGDPGAEGVGVSQIVELYYLSNSSSTLSGGSWQTSPPAYVKGRFYWTRSKVTWTDGNITYTTAVLARGINSANNTADTAKDAADAAQDAADAAQSTANTAKSTADTAKSTADAANSTLSVLNTQQGIFNKLTNNGALQGLYMSNGQLYINATYLKSGIISGLTLETYTNGTMTTPSGKKVHYKRVRLVDGWLVFERHEMVYDSNIGGYRPTDADNWIEYFRISGDAGSHTDPYAVIRATGMLLESANSLNTSDTSKKKDGNLLNGGTALTGLLRFPHVGGDTNYENVLQIVNGRIVGAGKMRKHTSVLYTDTDFFTSSPARS